MISKNISNICYLIMDVLLGNSIAGLHLEDILGNIKELERESLGNRVVLIFCLQGSSPFGFPFVSQIKLRILVLFVPKQCHTQ